MRILGRLGLIIGVIGFMACGIQPIENCPDTNPNCGGKITPPTPIAATPTPTPTATPTPEHLTNQQITITTSASDFGLIDWKIHNFGLTYVFDPATIEHDYDDSLWDGVKSCPVPTSSIWLSSDCNAGGRYVIRGKLDLGLNSVIKQVIVNSYSADDSFVDPYIGTTICKDLGYSQYATVKLFINGKPLCLPLAYGLSFTAIPPADSNGKHTIVTPVIPNTSASGGFSLSMTITYDYDKVMP